MQDILLTIMFFALAEIAFAMIFAILHDFKVSLFFLVVAALSIGAVWYAAKTSGVDLPEPIPPGGSWAMLLSGFAHV